MAALLRVILFPPVSLFLSSSRRSNYLISDSLDDIMVRRTKTLVQFLGTSHGTNAKTTLARKVTYESANTTTDQSANLASPAIAISQGVSTATISISATTHHFVSSTGSHPGYASSPSTSSLMEGTGSSDHEVNPTKMTTKRMQLRRTYVVMMRL
jgi:hypothetical protein